MTGACASAGGVSNAVELGPIAQRREAERHPSLVCGAGLVAAPRKGTSDASNAVTAHPPSARAATLARSTLPSSLTSDQAVPTAKRAARGLDRPRSPPAIAGVRTGLVPAGSVQGVAADQGTSPVRF